MTSNYGPTRDSVSFNVFSVVVIPVCKSVHKMVSISMALNTLLSIGIACICIVTVDARPTKNDVDLQELIKSDYLVHYLHNKDDLTKENDLIKSQIEEIISPYISNIRPEVQRQRIKRLGIAGHENIDMILSHLQKSSGPSLRRFRPALSLGGSFANLRNMMSKAGR